jgi:hypothetical protein
VGLIIFAQPQKRKQKGKREKNGDMPNIVLGKKFKTKKNG